MRTVMMKAQELAESILDSEIYQKMKQQENAVRRDPEAAKALGDMIEKRNRVENILSAVSVLFLRPVIRHRTMRPMSLELPSVVTEIP